MQNIFTAGNKGPGVRSDCFITYKNTNSGGIKIDLHSKLKTIYGEDIRFLALEVLEKFKISDAEVCIEDSGALSFVIAARLEAVIRQVRNVKGEFLPEMLEDNLYKTSADQRRFSRLYLPGNTPSMMLNAGIHKPDGIILDLEDSVASSRKPEARVLVRNALRHLNFYGAERMVRINQGPEGITDLGFIIPHNVNLILLPKCENPEQVETVETEISRLMKMHDITHSPWIMPIIESALGVENAFDISVSSKNIVALAIGLEDFTADLGVHRSSEGWESFYGRTRIVNACKAAGIQAIDSVFSDVGDEKGLRETIAQSKSLGFEGMGCIHPRQIKVVHESYAPDSDEIDRAGKIVDAFLKANEKGLGVVSLGTKMIDPPVVKRAQRIIDLALKMNLINSNWREKYAG